MAYVRRRSRAPNSATHSKRALARRPQVIIPNIMLREHDCEMYQDQPFEYISRDSEGSDSDTRRRAASELVKGLRKHYEEEVSGIFTGYINQLLERYHANNSDWRAKDAAMYLVTALSVTTATQSRGASTTNPFVRVLDFYGAHVLPEVRSAPPPQWRSGTNALARSCKRARRRCRAAHQRPTRACRFCAPTRCAFRRSFASSCRATPTRRCCRSSSACCARATWWCTRTPPRASTTFSL